MTGTSPNALAACWHLEHQVRQRLKPGARVGRVLRRLLPAALDDTVQGLAAAWTGEEFGLSVGDSPELYAAAYDAVHSCMHGKGGLLADAYRPHGVSIAVLTIGGQIVARSLIWRGGYVRCYGELSHALECVLRTACGMPRVSLRDYAEDHAVCTYRAETTTRTVTATATREWPDMAPELRERLESAGWRLSGTYRIIGQRTRSAVISRTRLVPDFHPYLD